MSVLIKYGVKKILSLDKKYYKIINIVRWIDFIARTDIHLQNFGPNVTSEQLKHGLCSVQRCLG